MNMVKRVFGKIWENPGNMYPCIKITFHWRKKKRASANSEVLKRLNYKRNTGYYYFYYVIKKLFYVL